MSTPATTSQTVGPFFKIGLAPLYRTELASPETRGKHLTIKGCIMDGQAHPVPDAILEIWQADAAGNYPQFPGPEDHLSQSAFFGFGRIPTDAEGSFRFSTIKPGRVAGPGAMQQAPHIVVSLFMRGLLTRLVTRIYFLGDPANDQDFALRLIEPDRRSTLMACPVAGNPDLLEWNVILQGEQETVFFDF
jgi:protocatechuate 3,4-dioxygenase, alpha subunit